MWVGLALNCILLLDYFIYCNDFFIMVSQAVQQILILIFCWLMTQQVSAMEETYAQKLQNKGRVAAYIPLRSTKFFMFFMAPSLCIALILLLAAVFTSFLAEAENGFSNTDSDAWILNLVLNCFISLVLVVIVCRSEERLKTFQQTLTRAYGEGKIQETDVVLIRSQQLRSLAYIFTVLTWIDVLIIVFVAVADKKDGSTDLNLCF